MITFSTPWIPISTYSMSLLPNCFMSLSKCVIWSTHPGIYFIPPNMISIQKFICNQFDSWIVCYSLTRNKKNQVHFFPLSPALSVLHIVWVSCCLAFLFCLCYQRKTYIPANDHSNNSTISAFYPIFNASHTQNWLKTFK